MTKREELQKLKDLRAKIIAAMDNAAENAEVESYTIGDGNGNQSTRRRSPKELMDWLKEVDSKIEALERQMQGSGIRTFGTNRYGRA